MWHCEKCGKENPDTSGTCLNCGKTSDEFWAPEHAATSGSEGATDRRLSPTPGRSAGGRAMIGIGVILILLAITALIVRGPVFTQMYRDAHTTSQHDDARLFRDVVGYGAYGAGAIGLALLLGGILTVAARPAQEVVSSDRGDGRGSEQAEASTIPELIERLARMKEAGVISQEEFETKKKDLLSRL
jgi:hypothetical protein